MPNVVNKTKAQRHTTCATKSKNNDKAFPTASLQNLENGENALPTTIKTWTTSSTRCLKPRRLAS